MGVLGHRRRTEPPAGTIEEVPTRSSASEEVVDAARFRRLIEASVRLQAVGVSHQDIERRARRDAITFNEAVELLDREKSGA